MANPHHPRNPDYGDLIFRRAVRLSNQPGVTTGELEDAVHAIRSRITHDGTTILSAESEFVRYPTTLCPAARGMIASLAGLPLATAQQEFYGGGKAREHCTHMHDLVWWMIRHAQRDEAVRTYECVIPDHPDGREIEMKLMLNGQEMLGWTVKDDVILGPDPFSGRHVMQKFVGWAGSHLEGDMLEAALMLQKGFLVSSSHKNRPIMGPFNENDRYMEGACWTYSPVRIEKAVRVFSYREFPEGEGLLEFRDPMPSDLS